MFVDVREKPITITINNKNHDIYNATYRVTEAYNGLQHYIDVTIPEDCTIEYFVGEDYVSTAPRFVDAGEYKVFYRATGDGYEDVESYMLLVITKIDFAFEAMNFGKTYDGEGPHYMSYTYYHIEDTEMTTPIAAPKDAGEYMVICNLIGSTNYNQTTKSYIFTISKSTPRFTLDMSKLFRTYNGEEVEFTGITYDEDSKPITGDYDLYATDAELTYKFYNLEGKKF